MEEKTGAVILAAGVSSVSKSEMLKQELNTLREAGIGPIAVVIGHEEEDVRRDLAHRKVLFVENQKYKTTKMFTSIRLGMEALEGSCGQVIIVNADSPSFSHSTLRALSQGDGELTIPMHDGKPGHPLCIRMDKLDAIRSYDGRNGIQGMIKKGLIRAELIAVNDPGIHMEAKGEDSLRNALKYQQSIVRAHPIRIDIDLRLAREDDFFDEDLAELLKEIDKCHSMNSACRSCGIAYSRGWKMIKKAEEMLGCDLVIKRVGGSGGGGSELTESGRRYLVNYEKILSEVVAFAEAVSKKYFE